MPLIDISLIEGRAARQKRRLIELITEAAVAALAVRPQSVRVILREVPSTHWAVGGLPKAAMDVKPGTKVNAKDNAKDND
ncbi:MAG: 4-oxalocrotonate tautomerase [Alphaproteobacteria bacterium]|nr:MAG: 4-oxalocrotonate tautomerase [Alphaproteobacteria bacterium]